MTEDHLFMVPRHDAVEGVHSRLRVPPPTSNTNAYEAGVAEIPVRHKVDK
jgi:hypothetical protein